MSDQTGDGEPETTGKEPTTNAPTTFEVVEVGGGHPMHTPDGSVAAMKAQERVAKMFASIQMLGDVETAIDDPIPGGGAEGRVLALGGRRLLQADASRALTDEQDSWTALLERREVVAPPYDPMDLMARVETSPSLPYLIDTVATNVSGFGIDLVPLFDQRDDKGVELKPTADQTDQRDRLELFVAGCNLPNGLEGVLDETDRDVETIGWGAIEVLRNRAGEVVALEPMQGCTVRLGRLGPHVLVELPMRHPSTGEIVLATRWRRFRSIIQIVEGRATYFREFGDPRPLNRRTGKYGEIGQPFADGMNATEAIFARIYSPRTPYGIPRWIGGLGIARMEHEAIDLMVSWFADSPIGAKLAMLAGGQWSSDSMKKAIDRIDRMARGTESAWTIIGLEAEKAASAAFNDGITNQGGARVALEDLTFELPPELHFGEGNLIDQSARRMARLFRLPPVYWGGSDDYSRAAVNSARATAEEQVIGPIRRLRWERRFNREILPQMGVHEWKIRLRGAPTTDDTEVAKALGAFVQGGGASPNALIQFWNDLTQSDVQPITDGWGDKPLAVTLALLGLKQDPTVGLAEIGAGFATERAQSAAALGGAGGFPGAPNGSAVPSGQGGAGSAGRATPASKEQAAAVASALEMVEEIARVRSDVAKAAAEHPEWFA